MKTVSVTRAPRKPRQVSRTVRLALEPCEGTPGVLEIRVTSGVKAPRTETFEYLVLPLAADFGRGFRLDKFREPGDEDEPKTYHVNLDGERSTCECLGFEKWGMGKDGKGCKHIAAAQALVNVGKL